MQKTKQIYGLVLVVSTLKLNLEKFETKVKKKKLSNLGICETFAI